MGDKKTFIEINGQRYDATSGHLLDLSAAVAKPAPSSATAHGSIDGFSRRPRAREWNDEPGIKHQGHKPSTTNHQPQTINHLHRPPQKSQTLMRPAVTKPSLRPTKAAGQGAITTHAGERSLPADHASRLLRAGITPQSSLITRFQHGTTDATPATSIEPQSTATTPHPPPHSSAAAHHSIPSPLDKRLEKAVHNASSHLQRLPARPRRVRPLHLASSAVAVLLLIGFFAFQNVPNFQMRLAASKAGFAAQFPTYQPAGFGLAGPIKAEPGTVALSFKSRTDNRSFTVHQQASDWNSDTLLHTIQDRNPDLHTYHNQGKTIYIYGGGNATWVDGGVRYEVAASNARLSQDQLQRLASSL